jgi:hypothetical protein
MIIFFGVTIITLAMWLPIIFKAENKGIYIAMCAVTYISALSASATTYHILTCML